MRTATGVTARRVRTEMRAIRSSNIINVTRNRSEKPLPANWRKLLRHSVRMHCGQPRRNWFESSLPEVQRLISQPGIVIPPESSPSLITFVLSRDKRMYYLQRRAIDWALMLSDTMRWPVPKVQIRSGGNRETYVITDLRRTDILEGVEHSFHPELLREAPGINWLHLETYLPKGRQAPYLAIKTRCGHRCECRLNLKHLWSLGWEMHY